MKKVAAILLIAVLMLFCVGCGPYGDYAGTYSRKGSAATYTIKLSSRGSFKFERKYLTKDPYNPFDSDTYNKREGSFEVNNNKITIEFSYYEPAKGTTIYATATAKLSGNKLVVTGSDEIAGTYIKK